MGTGGADGPLWVRLAADPVSVPGARRFVRDGLESWGQETLVDKAALCVSELAGNAALHAGCTFMHVTLQQRDGGVVVAVEDDGMVPPDVVAPRMTWPGLDEEEVPVMEHPTTGRGLAIVSMLARDWGVEPTDAGKRIWAELTDAEVDYGIRMPRRAVDPAPAAGAALPPGWKVVRLAGCPVRLSLRQDEHLDELVRELQLISDQRHSAHSAAIAAQLHDLLLAPAHARYTGRRIAELAAAAGHAEVDVDMAMPVQYAGLVHKLQAVVEDADDLCDQMQLLTLSSPPDVRCLRAWMTHEIVAQLEHDQPPTRWEDWLRNQ